MLHYPMIDPIAFSIGPLSVRWYGVAYAVGFMLAWSLGCWAIRKQYGIWSYWCGQASRFDDLIFYGMLSMIIGGRVGYMVFYQLNTWMLDPLLLLKVWQGGMSFHGGLLGVLACLYYQSWRQQCSVFELSDAIVPLVPIGLLLGRLANFINGELWGRVTDVPWAMVFPWVDAQSRHPSQLYEMMLEGCVLFVILWQIAKRCNKPGIVTASFLLLYSIMRFMVEFFREPDIDIGFVWSGWLTMGQCLSIPMFIVALGIFYRLFIQDRSTRVSC